MALLPPPESRCKFIFANGFEPVFQLLLKAFLGHGSSCQIFLRYSEQPEVCWSQIWALRGMRNSSHTVFCEEIGNVPGRVDRRIVPVQEPFSSSHFRSFLLEHFKELLQHINDIKAVDSFATGNKVGLNRSLAVKKGKQHPLVSGILQLGLVGTRTLQQSAVVACWYKIAERLYDKNDAY